METLKAMKTRRSIRKFKGKSIPIDKLEEIVTCGMFAPSAGNEQPWHFLLITDKKVLTKIPQVHEHAKMMNSADAGILLCFDPSLEKHDKMAVQDCAAATQNMLLAIHDLGYGGCWLGVYPREKRMKGLQTLLNIPDPIVPFSLIAIGVPDEQKEEIDRFCKDRLHYDTW